MPRKLLMLPVYRGLAQVNPVLSVVVQATKLTEYRFGKAQSVTRRIMLLTWNLEPSGVSVRGYR